MKHAAGQELPTVLAALQHGTEAGFHQGSKIHVSPASRLGFGRPVQRRRKGAYQRRWCVSSHARAG